jgi:hypothetical protein
LAIAGEVSSAETLAICSVTIIMAAPNTTRGPMIARNAMFPNTCLTHEADCLADLRMMAQMWEHNNDRIA